MILLLLALQSAECRVGCTYEGYTSGFYQKPHCLCYDLLDYEAVRSPKKLRSLHNQKAEEVKEEESERWNYSSYLKSK